MTVIGSDTFAGRTVTGSWGTASDGHTWIQAYGVGSLSVGGGHGQITADTGINTMLLGSVIAGDVDIRVRFTLSSTADTASITFRSDSTAQNAYRCRYTANNVQFTKILAGTTTSLLGVTTITITPGNFYWFHVQASGSTFSYNFWADGSAEPAGWMATKTDASFPTGLVGVHAKLNATSDTATFDSFQMASLTNQLDLAGRARINPPTTLRDVAARARLTSRVQRDLTARVRLLANTSTRDLAARARLLSFGARDLAVRASIDEALLPLPNFAVPQITVQIGTASFTPLDGSFSIGEDISGRSTCQLSIHDPTGTLHVRYRQKVLVTHSVEGVIFRGFVSSASERNLSPNANNTIQISCIDEHWLADKRTYEGDEFSYQRAGVAAAFAAVELADEGVSASAAIDYDTTQADFGAGILTNVVAATNEGTSAIGDGDLELAAAGQGLSIVESSLSDFVAGTLTSLQANGQGTDGNGFLSLLALWGIIYSATSTVQGGGNLFTYNQIWSTAYTIASGDQLFYEVWIASTSPESKAGVDIVFTDGTTLRDFNAPVIVDQQGIPCHPNQDISFLARDKWYARTFSLTPLAGKTTAYATLAFEGDQIGTYTAYFRHIFLITATGTRVVIFDSDQLAGSPTAQQMQNNGYSDVSLQVGVVFEKKGQRISPAYPLDRVGIARQSLMSWTVSLPTGHTLKIEASLDGGITWQTCTSAQPIPGVVAGMRLSGQSLMLRETLTNTSPDPTQTSFLFDVTASIQPSYISAKSDVVTSTSLLSQWNTGTLTNCQWLNGALSLIGFSRYWFSASLVGQTTWGSSSPVVSVQDTQLQLQSGTGASCISRMDFAGQWQNFICETDINVTGSTSSDAGIAYRTTGWQNANNTYAYMASIKPSQVFLGRGTNSASGAGVFTQIATATLTLTAGDWHRLKVVVNGNTHQVYIDNVLYITATDSTYPGPGYIGLRHFNGSGSTDSSRFDSFGVVSALSGTRVSQPVDLSGAMAVQDSYFGATTSVPSGSSLLVEASVDGGSTWYPCVNGASLSALLPSGMPLTGVSLITRVTLTTTTATALPTIAGMTTWIVGVLSSSGSRISPPLSLSQVSRVGNSVLGWQANLSNDATTLGVDVSTDGKSWMDASNGNGLPIPLFAPTQDPPFVDTFSADMTASYISASLPKSESNTASWTVDSSADSLTATGGQAALLVNPNQTVTSSGGEMILDLDIAESAGAAWQLSSNYSSGYLLSIRDAQATFSANRIRLYRIFGGVPVQIGLGARIDFQRGTPIRFKIVWVKGTITVTVNGGSQQTLVYTDPSPLTAPGTVALRANGGTQRFYQWRVQNYGDDVSSQLLYTRLRLATTDPLYTPQVLSLTAAIYGPTIGDGALIPNTSYSVRSGSTNTIAQDLDDLARQSNYWWRILNGILYFQPTTGMLAPWIATGQDLLLGTVGVTQVSDLYRNEQIIIGGTDIEARSDVRVADGLRQGFDTGDTIDSIDSILVNDQSVSFGLQGVDTGKEWYYQQGQKGITQNAASSPLPVNTTVVINYQGIIPIVVKATHVGQVALLSALDGTSGKVTVVEKADGLTSAAAQHLAVSRVSQYAVLSVDLSFTTLRRGLHIGQLLTVFLPQHGLSNQTFLITKVDYAPVMSVNNGQTSLLEYFTVEATSGPIVGSWVHMFS